MVALRVALAGTALGPPWHNRAGKTRDLSLRYNVNGELASRIGPRVRSELQPAAYGVACDRESGGAATDGM